MSPRRCALLALSMLAVGFSVGRHWSVPVAAATGALLLWRRQRWSRSARATDPAPLARMLRRGVLILGLWSACFGVLLVDWVSSDVLLVAVAVTAIGLILARAEGQVLELLLVGTAGIGACVVFGASAFPAMAETGLVACVAFLMLLALSGLDLSRALGRLQGQGPSNERTAGLSAPFLVVGGGVLTCVLVPMFVRAPSPESPAEWSEQLGAVTGFTDSVDLSRLGLLKSDDRSALVVSLWEAEPDRAEQFRRRERWGGDLEREGGRHPLLLRGASLGDWNGHRFQSLSPLPTDPPLAPRTGREGRFVRQDVKMAAHGSDTLFALNRPLSGSAGVRVWQGQVTYDTVARDAVEYSVVSRVLSAADRGRLRQRWAAHPDPRYVDDRHISARLAAEAQRLIKQSGADNPYTKAAFLERWFTERRGAGEFSYTRFNRNVGADPIDSFVFETRAGHCSFFATAMVLMLRSLDIPARLAVGFRGGAWSDRMGAYRVLQRNAHAWVEVFFNGVGWVDFDPTPGERRLDLGAPSGTGTGTITALQGGAEAAPDVPAGAAAPVGWWWLWLVLPTFAVLLLRRRATRLRAERDSARPEATLSERLIRILDRAGGRAGRGATLRERLRSAQGLPENSLPDLERVVAWLYRARYGGRALEDEERTEAVGILDRTDSMLPS